MRIASRDIHPHTLLPREMAVILCPSPLQGTEHGQCFFLQWPRSFSPLLPSKVAVKSRLLGCRDKARPLLPPLTVRPPPLLSLSKTAVAVDSCVLQKRSAITVTFLSGRYPSPFGNSVKQESPHAIFLCRRWSTFFAFLGSHAYLNQPLPREATVACCPSLLGVGAWPLLLSFADELSPLHCQSRQQ